MNAFRASYFDGQTSRLHDVEVRRIDASTIRLVGEGIDRSEAIASLRLSPRLARITRTIEFADGARILAADHELLDTWFPAEDRMQRMVDRLERHAHAVAASIVVCLAMGVVTFAWGVPWLADRIASQIPPSIESRLGDEVLGQLDRFFGFAPSAIEASRQSELSARFARLSSGQPDEQPYRLIFRDAPGVGPNALAIPGGTIIVTDQLVTLFNDDREFDAVVAHEIGHQHHRHAMRQTLRSSFVLVIAALFTGDVSSASAIVIGIPTFLLQSHYSRGFEEEADRFAFTALAAHETSPAWFAAAIRRLDEHHDLGEANDSGISYLSSHPSTPSRIAAAEVSGEEFIAAHPDLIRETPGYDACETDDICPEDDDETCQDDECLEPNEPDESDVSAAPSLPGPNETTTIQSNRRS